VSSSRPGGTVRVVVSADPQADAQELAQLLERLRAEVAEREFDLVADPGLASPPGGAKAADAAGVSSVLIALAASGGILTSLVGLLQGWLARSSARGLAVEIDGDRLELADPTSEERQRMINAWLSRHERIPDATGPGLGEAP
jgi:hypothetical protein